jgi:RNA polymerase-binding transcription factor DksA
MIANLVDVLFGCWHKNYSFPITNKNRAGRSAAASVTGTYVVCLDCGKEFPYDWQRMKVISGVETAADVIEAPARAHAKAA